MIPSLIRDDKYLTALYFCYVTVTKLERSLFKDSIQFMSVQQTVHVTIAKHMKSIFFTEPVLFTRL